MRWLRLQLEYDLRTARRGKLKENRAQRLGARGLRGFVERLSNRNPPPPPRRIRAAIQELRDGFFDGSCSKLIDFLQSASGPKAAAAVVGGPAQIAIQIPAPEVEAPEDSAAHASGLTGAGGFNRGDFEGGFASATGWL
jgi:hypothetical protein